MLKELKKASALYGRGYLAPARQILERILAQFPGHTDTLSHLAATAGRAGDLPAALDYASRAIKLDPTSGTLMRNVGQILFAMSRHEQAVEAFRIATQLDPRDALSENVYGIALRHLERWDEAIAASLRAIKLDPTLADAFDNLATILAVHGDYVKALQLFHEATTLAPRSAMAWNNLGNFILAMGGRTVEAADAFRTALALAPDQPTVHMNLGIALLKLGDFENGWREYEHRWEASAFLANRRPSVLPRWEGSAAPRTVLLHAEQGLGDTLQFCRYASLVADRGHRVVLEVQPELVELLANSLASERVNVVTRTSDYPALSGLPPVDAHCPLMSLPMILGTRLESVPAAPYLRADPARCNAWRERLAAVAGGFRVGLVWAGNPRRDFKIDARQVDARRSTSLASLGPLLALPGIGFVSLQKGAGTEELRAGHLTAIYDAAPELNSFADTAALVANLDLVISVDTSVAHLVGGMGRPVWMLSRYDACFRWLDDRADTPWYPSMRIFRQTADRNWGPAIAALAQSLGELPRS